MKNLAHASREVAVITKMLWQCHDIRHGLADMLLQAEYPGLIRVTAGQKTGAALVALRVLRISAREQHAALRQAVDIRCLYQFVPVGAEMVVHVIGHHQQHIRRRR